jgi:hypothetical protein
MHHHHLRLIACQNFQLLNRKCSGSGAVSFWPSGSVIICTDPDPYMNNQK